MRIQHRVVGEVAIIDLDGRLTLEDGCDLLRDTVNRLIQQGRAKIVLNLPNLPYVDSAGLGEIVRTYTSALHHGGGMKLLRPTKRVKDLLIITKIWPILEAFDSEEDAVRSFPTSAGV
jgi:anti-sigma B factor antagonist